MGILVSLAISVPFALILTFVFGLITDFDLNRKSYIECFALLVISGSFFFYFWGFNFDEKPYSSDIWHSSKEKDEKPKHKSSEESKPEESIDKLTPPSKLLDVSEKWLNSYDDGKFSTYELYLLSDVQSLTGVKVYDKALSLEKSSSNTTPDSFRDLLFKANRTLNLINTAK